MVWRLNGIETRLCSVNIYINDLSELIDQCQRGVLIDNKIISHLFYADDFMLMAESEEDLQILLDILSSWCTSNKMNINTDKTKIMHFLTLLVVRTDYIFTCGESQIEIVDKYRYLGILLNDTLGYDITAKYIAQSATWALGLLISKSVRLVECLLPFLRNFMILWYGPSSATAQLYGNPKISRR